MVYKPLDTEWGIDDFTYSSFNIGIIWYNYYYTVASATH